MKLNLKRDETGSILITILVMLVIVSLGTGVAVMLNSSSIQSVENNIELRATNLAEAGFRYAGTEYANAGSDVDKKDRLTAKLQRLEKLHHETVTLGNNGSFALSLYPFFFMSSSDGENVTSLSLRVPGEFPDGFAGALPATGSVFIKRNNDESYIDKMYDYSNGSTSGTSVFTLTLDPDAAIETDDRVYLSFATGTQTSLSQGDDLTAFSDTGLGALLPERNGIVTLYEEKKSDGEVEEKGTYRYRKRIIDDNSGDVILTDLQEYEGKNFPDITFDTTSYNYWTVIPTQVKIDSVGTAGSGGMASSRRLELNVFMTTDYAGSSGSVAADLDLNGDAEGTAETFSDGNTLRNWSVPDASDVGQYITTSVNVSTIFGDNQGNSTDNFLTFQNFTTVDEDSDEWYMMAIDKIHLASIGKGSPDKDGYYSSYYNLYGVWGNDEDNMYIVGENGTILHYDGTDFNLEAAYEDSGEEDCNWVATGDEVCRNSTRNFPEYVGNDYRETCTQYQTTTICSTGYEYCWDYWYYNWWHYQGCVGNQNNIPSYVDQNRVTRRCHGEETTETTCSSYKYCYDEKEEVCTPVPGNDKIDKTLRAVWGLPSSADVADAKANGQTIPTDQVFVAGDNGMTLIDEHGCDSTSCWEKVGQDDNKNLYAAYGTSWDHFDAYGNNGSNPYNWDSSRCDGVANNGLCNYWDYDDDLNFRCLWAIDYTYPYNGSQGREANQNIIVGNVNNQHGLIVHEFYTPVVTINNCKLRGVWGSNWTNSSGDIYVVGDDGRIFHNTVGGTAGHQAWVNGWINSEITSTVWSQAGVSEANRKNLNGVYGNSATDFYMVGDDGTILYYDGSFHKAKNREGADAITANLNSIWGSEETGIWAVGDNGTIVYLGRPANTIVGYILPFNLNATNGDTEYTYYNMENGVNDVWKDNGGLLSYSIQLKQVWANALNYAAAGVNFRWNGNEGYGVSFMRYDSITSITDDGIPNGIKPSNDLNDALLLVLWKKEGTTYTWLAYKDISDDDDVVKTKTENEKEIITGPVDLSSLVVRVEEKTIDGKQINDISVYYGNASESNTDQKGTGGSDNICNNTKRNRYNSTFLTQTTDDITWPSDLSDWEGCDATSCSTEQDTPTKCCNIDIFTLVDGWTVNGTQSVTLRGDEYVTDYILRTSDFTTSANSDGDLKSSNEWAIHAFGDIGSHEDSATLSVTDFAVQLGTDSEGSQDSPSTFSDIR